MRIPPPAFRVGIALGFVLISAGPSRAEALRSYRLIDLGSGSATFDRPGPGQGRVISPDGKTAYDFPVTDRSVFGNAELDILRSLPQPTNAPRQFAGFSRYGWPVFLNSSGTLLLTNEYGASGHGTAAGSQVLMATRAADGTVGPFTPLFSSSGNSELRTGGVARTVALNDEGDVLGYHQPSTLSTPGDYVIGDTHGGPFVDLKQFIGTWEKTSVNDIQMDDRGRIVFTANQTAPWYLSDPTQHTLLLVPDGVSATPIPVPEPGTITIVALGVFGLAMIRKPSADRRPPTPPPSLD